MKKKILITVLSVILILLAVGAAFVYKSYKSIVYVPQQNLQAPIEIPDEAVITVQEADNYDKPQVTLFYVDWCGYCRKFMPVFGQLAKKYKDKYSFVVVNCDNPENKKLVEEFHIMGFPLLFIIDKKYNHSFSMHYAATAKKEIMEEELNNYIKFREKYLKNNH